ncbi:hypothetical protein HOE04_04530 [archaeon]|jgi:hypothetical protein|nr:hypothetical protein [archaeon]
MSYINTTFTHGNGPYSRCIEWAVSANDVREERGLERLQIVVPLVYPGIQEDIMKAEIENNVSENFLEKHPDEIWLDGGQGELLEKLMFKGKDYKEHLKFLAENYSDVETEMWEHLDGVREIERLYQSSFQKGLDKRILEEIDLRDCSFQLGLNNRIQTGLPNQFYTAGGAGPFDELLRRAYLEEWMDRDIDIIDVFSVARKMIKSQRIIFSNEPGVFSYDKARRLGVNEVLTPPFIHPPKENNTELSGKGIYFLETGIEGIMESDIYDAIGDFGMRIYGVNDLGPSQINNPNIVAQYARAGWSSVWLSQLSEKGFISPAYQEGDDPEMIFNERSMRDLGLGAIIEDNAHDALEKSLELSESVGKYNAKLKAKYGTLDGIRYTAEKVVDCLED